MIVHVFESAKKASVAAAHLFAAAILRKPDCVLGLATGSTPVDTYKQLIKWHQDGLLDFSACVSFNLDEYLGLAPDHPASYRHFMNQQLFDHINIKESFVPRGDAKSPKAECKRYDKLIAQYGGIDIQFLGLGNNGHIGFNEPDSVFSGGSGVVDLTESTIEANTRFFDKAEDVPRQAISMGCGTIMKAGQIVLAAFGKGKAQAVRGMVKGPIDPQCPASILQLHDDVVIMLDEDAASLL